MFNGYYKNRINISHRRMKTTIQSFQKGSTKKQQQKIKQFIDKAKIFYYKEQKFAQTVQLLQQYLEYKPNDNEALYLCGVSYLHLNQPFQAIRKLQKISYSSLNKEQSLLLLAMAYGKIQNSDKSLQIINQCLNQFPKFQEGYCYRGKLYIKFQEYQIAQRDFIHSLKLNPSSFISRAALGDCYYQQHKFQQALKVYDQSLQYLDRKSQSNKADILLKKGICYFQLLNYNEVIHVLEQLSDKNANSQSYFYLGVSYIKTDKKAQGILNLEYCIRVQAKTNISLIQRAFKILIEIFLNDYQFYQAINILKLTENFQGQLSFKYWKVLVEGCMLIIKSHFKDGLSKLNQVYDIIKGKKIPLAPTPKVKYQNQFMESPKNKNVKQLEQKRPNETVKGRKSFSLKHVRKISLYEQSRNKSVFKTLKPQRTPFVKTQKKIGQIKLRKFFHGIKKKNVKKVQKSIFTEEEIIFLMPILLKFKAYSQFFMNNYLRSLDTYEEYQSYLKNVFGQQNTDVVYNRILCEGFLLHQTQLYKQALQKFDLAIVEYKKNYNSIPVQPVLYKIATLLKLALPHFFSEEQSSEVGYQYLQRLLDLSTHHSQQLKTHHLSHYYLAIMYFLCEKYNESQIELQKTLKIVEQCSWKYLYLKGCIQIILDNFYDAIKQFTAGLILQQSPDLYLGRSISFLLQGTKRKSIQNKKQKVLPKNSFKVNKEKKNNVVAQTQNKQQVNSEVFIENSFEDLQKFIELQTDQDKISLWVTKILFYNEAYEQAIRALQKVQNKSGELQQLQFWLKLYEGQFQQCGQIGNLVMYAFEGNLLTSQQQNSILISKNQTIIQTLIASKLNPLYEKWLVILHLFKRQKYSILIKYMQRQIFQTQSVSQQLQLKYNIGVAYLMHGQKGKAFHYLENLVKQVDDNDRLKQKINKILKFNFDQDECLADLNDQIGVNENHRLSEYLPYKPVQIKEGKTKRFFLKPSIPFLQFPKPCITIEVNKQFISSELQIQLIQKRIQAPWIKRNKQKIQFTDQIVDAYTDFLKETKQMIAVDQSDNFNSNSLQTNSRSSC